LVLALLLHFDLNAESFSIDGMFDDLYSNTSKGKRLTTFRGKEGALEIVDHSFGTFDSEGRSFCKTTKILYKKNQTYGWIIKLKSSPEYVYITEFLKLPAPGNWITDSNTKVSDDERVGLTTMKITPRNNIISHYWSIAPNDPLGDYCVKVFVDDAKPITFFLH
jgi:hypothetical protein